MSARVPALLFAAVVSLVGPVRAAGQDPVPPPPEPTSDAYRLAIATIQTLSQAGISRDRLVAVSSRGLPEVLRSTRAAVGRLDASRTDVQAFTSSGDEAIRAAAGSLEESLDALIQPLVSRVRAMEQLLEPGREPVEWGRLTDQVTRANARLDEAWRLLPASAVVVSQALVDSSRTLDGRLAYMKLTRAEHRAMEAELTRLFPRAADPAPNDHPVVVAVRVLQSFVNSGWRAADEGRPALPAALR